MIAPKRPSETLHESTHEQLEQKDHDINLEVARSRKRLKPQSSFDNQFWAQAVTVDELLQDRADVKRAISLGNFEASEMDWEKTNEAKKLFEEMRANEMNLKISKAHRSAATSHSEGNTMCLPLMKFFTTSKLGHGISFTGAGARNTSDQSNFRNQMIDVAQRDLAYM
ncbi:hypothetical protein N7495_000823 [Penicillium taxi]|uniref:uncharacterized protein n=1 Tax=Penicillium taxi TaxID=168475 RepID=UPI002544F875|nr:uncharacterized protein N7495_000823 [Penicillium taxi]KAJ5908141.1 hypothetical protein N7495_000823 [Penicillium taxi]